MPEPKPTKPKSNLPKGDVYDGLSVEALGGHFKLKPSPENSKQITLTAVSFIGACGVVFLTKENAQPIAYYALMVSVLVPAALIWWDKQNDFTRKREAPGEGALQPGIDPGG